MVFFFLSSFLTKLNTFSFEMSYTFQTLFFVILEIYYLVKSYQLNEMMIDHFYILFMN